MFTDLCLVIDRSVYSLVVIGSTHFRLIIVLNLMIPSVKLNSPIEVCFL